jgi:uncharacterized protein YejL (UPF0352 family)
MKTLQQEYQLIKEGKGNKDHFLKVAKHMFPEYITSGNDFNSTVHILKSKSLLSEGVGGIITQSTKQPNWFEIFNKKVTEAIGVKTTKEYGDQNEFEKPAPEVAKDLANQFDNNNPDNIDNVYGQSFLMGFYTEMQDEKNKDKSVYELKQIVLKNMVKNINYYATEASFGIKGIGYKKDVVGGGEPVAPKGKHKSSGYGDIPKAVKEGQETRSVGSMIKPEGFQVGDKVKYKGMNHEITRIIDDRIYIKNLKYNKRPDTWVKAIDLKKSLSEIKRIPITNEMKEVEKSSQSAALEVKLKAIDEAIEKRKAKLSLAESEELAEMIDPSMIKILNKEIKELEKHKAKTQKIYEKMTGKAKEEVIDEDNDMMSY